MDLRLVLLLPLLAGCASTAPELRSGATAGQGALIEGCRNLADDAKLVRSARPGYATTRMSALREGAAAGLQEGLNDNGPAYAAIAGSLANPVAGESDDVFQDGFLSPKAYCRAYANDRRLIAELVPELLRELGHTLEAGSIEDGTFRTRLLDRESRDAKWKDNYIVTVTEERTNRVIVRVLRNIYISRQDSAFHQATSDGQNEAWILMQIEDAFAPAYRY